MARNKLTETQVRAAKTPGLFADGDGLYLAVTPTGARSWRFIFKRAGKRTELGLGSYGAGVAPVTLAAARAKADAVRAVIASGGDPKATSQPAAAVAVVSFGDVALEYIAAMESGWRNEKHRAQWKMTLEKYAAPIWKLPISDVDTVGVLACLKPIWTTKAETATRVRGRIERVLDSAKARGLRTGDNPAFWRGNLDHLLPAAKKLVRGHHAALPHTALPDFVGKLSAQKGTAAKALCFAILTAARSGEVRLATWSEFDLDAGLWTVPGDRMKAGREHRVPLSEPAVAIIRSQIADRIGDHVFPGQKSGRPMSDMSLTAVLRRMGRGELTAHGFRSTFRDWVSDATSHPREVAEAALAHIVGDATERAYRRGDALEKRRILMADWAAYCRSAV